MAKRKKHADRFGGAKTSFSAAPKKSGKGKGGKRKLTGAQFTSMRKSGSWADIPD